MKKASKECIQETARKVVYAESDDDSYEPPIDNEEAETARRVQNPTDDKYHQGQLRRGPQIPHFTLFLKHGVSEHLKIAGCVVLPFDILCLCYGIALENIAICIMVLRHVTLDGNFKLGLRQCLVVVEDLEGNNFDDEDDLLSHFVEKPIEWDWVKHGDLHSQGIVVFLEKKLYWYNGEDVRNTLIYKSMRRDRFIEIMRFLHCCDNTQLDMTDKMTKLRPFLNLLKERFLNNYLCS
ncbi:hypothetical protein NQ318_022606 [Aromia moschata]|uniref:PiggyBac transposable element-derived protein domain-containing protein n=1 Tax=Aromia moschata TaxID=1265417 RepID=A0AAV8XD95_9CUCU|nr:hypothetical protein NQ318_022606 [Aromia moschata]